MKDLNIKDYRSEHPLTLRVLRIVWKCVWMLFCRWTPQGIGLFYAWRNFCLRCFGAKIGKRCHVYPGVRVWQPWMLEMDDDACLSNEVECYSVDRITLGRNAIVSPGAFLCTASHDIDSRTFDLTHAPISIGDNAWVGARAIVLPGRVVGVGGIVAAGAVVTKDVGPSEVVGGNPAQFIKKRNLS